VAADTTVVYETPLRVFAILPQNISVQFCDYLFPDETLTDSAKRFQDLVGIDVGDIDASAEHIPSQLAFYRISLHIHYVDFSGWKYKNCWATKHSV